MNQSGLIIAGKTGQVYCFHCKRATLITMEEGTLPRHFISMEEPKVITIGHVISMQERILPRQFEY